MRRATNQGFIILVILSDCLRAKGTEILWLLTFYMFLKVCFHNINLSVHHSSNKPTLIPEKVLRETKEERKFAFIDDTMTSLTNKFLKRRQKTVITVNVENTS